MKVMRKEYEKKATEGAKRVIQFESDRITLNIPQRGIQRNGWEITPINAPEVSWFTCMEIACMQ